jgi:AcrR family transcriptional regulator
MHTDGSLRERLIDVGVELVTTEGVGSLGLREIARRAGVSHGAPRRYFPTHQALLSAIAHRGFAELAGRFAAATGGAQPPHAQLGALARGYLAYARERRGMFELMFRHDLLDGATRGTDRPPLRASTLPLFTLLVDLVTRHRAEHPAPDGAPPPAVTAAALWANLHGTAQLWLWGSLPLVLTTTGERPDDRLDELVEAALAAHLGPVGR